MLYDPNWQHTPIDPISKILLKAADLIDERGLAKCTNEDEKKQLCIMGAIRVAVSGHAFRGEHNEIIGPANRIGAFCGGGPLHTWTAAVHFNNHPDTTKEMVVAKLRECALADMAPAMKVSA